jgi:hypothetical protein
MPPSADGEGLGNGLQGVGRDHEISESKTSDRPRDAGTRAEVKPVSPHANDRVRHGLVSPVVQLTMASALRPVSGCATIGLSRRRLVSWLRLRRERRP